MSVVLEAIKSLLKFNSKGCSLAQVAKISERKQKDVLAEINLNRDLVHIDSKGKITKLHTDFYIRNVFQQQYRDDKVYTLNGINYGADAQIRFAKEANYPQLHEKYWCGGFGDSYPITIILYNPQNRAFVESLGMRFWLDVEAELKQKSVDDFWQELS